MSLPLLLSCQLDLLLNGLDLSCSAVHTDAWSDWQSGQVDECSAERLCSCPLPTFDIGIDESGCCSPSCSPTTPASQCVVFGRTSCSFSSPSPSSSPPPPLHLFFLLLPQQVPTPAVPTTTGSAMQIGNACGASLASPTALGGVTSKSGAVAIVGGVESSQCWMPHVASSTTAITPGDPGSGANLAAS